MVKYSTLLAWCLSIIAGDLLSQPGTWTRKADHPGSAAFDLTAFSIDGKGYFTLGYDNNAATLRPDLWRYDPVDDSWAQLADFGGSTRAGAVAFSVDGKGIVGTGDNGEESYQDLWRYDPAANTWGAVGPFPQPTSGARSFVVDGTAFVCGGNSRDLWAYDAINDSWSARASYPGGSIYGSLCYSFAIGQKGYFGGGVVNIPWTYPGDFWEYDPGSDQWTEKTGLVGAVSAHGIGLSANGHGFVTMGNGAGEQLWSYDPDTDTWTACADFPLLPDGSIERGTAFSTGDRLYVGAGENAEGNVAPEWYMYHPFCDLTATFNYNNEFGIPEWCPDMPRIVQEQSNWIPGGVFSTTTGLFVDPFSGEMDPTFSLPGSYLVTYTLPATSECQEYQTTAPFNLVGFLCYADQDGDGSGDPNSTFANCTPDGCLAIAGDECPFDPAKQQPGSCGCGNAEPGSTCDDGNSGTVNDIVGNNCICAGDINTAILTGPAPESHLVYDRVNGVISVPVNVAIPVLLLDAAGRVVQQANGPLVRFGTQHLPPGLYVVCAERWRERVMVF